MSQWLDMFREARVQIDTSVQLGQNGAVRSESELTAPKYLSAPAIESENRPVWDANDWRALYDERAAIREYDGEMSRHDAERLALDDCVAHWLTMHPPPATDDTAGCVHCGTALGDDGVPVLAGTGHTWLHSACHRPWLAERRRHAAEVLAVMDVGVAG